MSFVEEAAKEGYTQEDVQQFLSEKATAAKAEGYSDEEITKYVRDNVIQQPDFNASPVESQGQANLAPRQAPKNLMEAIQTGWGWSNLALGREVMKGTEGQLPNMAVDENTPWYLRAATNLTTTALDIPSMIAGGAIGGGPANPITAMGGAFALPMGLRKVFIDAITNGQVGTRKEFADRVLGTMWETAKGWMTGAATAGAGKLATEAVSALPGAAKAILPTATELATLTEVGARLEGHAPEPQSLIDNAVVLGVAKSVLPNWATPPQRNVLTDIYEKTGIPPQHVTSDAIKGNAGVWQDVLDGRVPDAYKQGIETPPSAQTQTQRTSAFHGTSAPPFTEFKGTHTKSFYYDPATQKSGQIEHSAVYLTDSKDLADAWSKVNPGTPRIVSANIEGDLLTVDAKGQSINMVEGLAMKQAMEQGKKGVRFNNVIDSPNDAQATPKTIFAVFDPGNIKIKDQAEQQKPQAEAPTMMPDQQAQAKAFLEQPFAEIPQAPNEPSRPTHMNYNRIQTTDEAKMALSQLSTIYEAKIKEQQQSPRTWEQSHQDAAKVLGDLLQSDPKTVTAFLKGEQAGPSATAQLLARKELTLGFTEDLMRSRAALQAKGDQATPEDVAGFLAQVERVSNVQAGFLGQRADVARALNALKSTKRDAERSQAILDAINSYGGEQNVSKLVEMLGEYDNPAQAIAFAKKATKATTWDMVVEAWKAGLVSGLRTNEVNVLSTAAFTTLRLPTEAIAALYGGISRAEDRVTFSELPARALGMAAGIRDGFKVAGGILRTGDNIMTAKTDTFEPKIPGKTGEVIRLPFRLLSASDAIFKAVNERGELYALATKQAMKEGQTFGSQEFFGRVADLVKAPPDEMSAAAKDAALRYTFNKPLGPAGKAFQTMVRETHLEWMFPFITTPGNIFKETLRMTPGANLAVKEWRADYEAGGAKRARALAEVTVGTAIMAAVVAAVQEGTITGNGQPDKKMRATDRAAGWKPYSVKVNGQYIDGYLRMAPIGPLIGLAADGAEFMNYMTHEERDQWARMLAFAFASNVTNQTFMTGATNFVNVLQDPSRYGQNYVESLASSLVPSIIGQTAGDMDPLLREIHGMRDAMIARIPGQREGLMPKRDLFGQPIASPERLWWGSPFTTTAISTDKVRTEASRVGFATPDIPKNLDVLPGKAFGNLDKIALTPEQRDVFSTQAGQTAYTIMNGIVHEPGWDQQPAIIQRQTFEKVFKKSRDMAQRQALAGADPALMKQAVEKIQQSLQVK